MQVTVESYEIAYPNEISHVIFAVFIGNHVYQVLDAWSNDADPDNGETTITGLHGEIFAACAGIGVTLGMIAEATGIIQADEIPA